MILRITWAAIGLCGKDIGSSIWKQIPFFRSFPILYRILNSDCTEFNDRKLRKEATK